MEQKDKVQLEKVVEASPAVKDGCLLAVVGLCHSDGDRGLYLGWMDDRRRCTGTGFGHGQ